MKPEVLVYLWFLIIPIVMFIIDAGILWNNKDVLMWLYRVFYCVSAAFIISIVIPAAFESSRRDFPTPGTTYISYAPSSSSTTKLGEPGTYNSEVYSPYEPGNYNSEVYSPYESETDNPQGEMETNTATVSIPVATRDPPSFRQVSPTVTVESSDIPEPV